MKAEAYRHRHFRGLVYALALPLFSGCAGPYFEPAGSPPDPSSQFTLQTLPFDEYWTGLVFNGNKIGFTRFTLAPMPAGRPGYSVRAEAPMHFRFLGVDEKVTLKARDQIADDLTLIEFACDYDLDGTRMNIQGSSREGIVETQTLSAGKQTMQSHHVSEKIYPTSIIALYPVLHGLEVGREFVYAVYNGETRSIAKVRQKILGHERSELFEGPAFRVQTSLHGQEVDTWIDASGRPVLEISLGGVFIAGLEHESMARHHLALAAFNKSESLLEFSRISTSPPISRPQSVRQLDVVFRGFGDSPCPTTHCSGAVQRTV